MSRRVVFVVFEGLQSLDLTGPLEVFSAATRWLEHHGLRGGYAITVAALEPGPVRCTSGLEVVADRALASLRAVDTLVVVGGEGADAAAAQPAFRKHVARLSGRARRTASVCTGAFVLAAAGLLDGREVTTHWLHAARLQRRAPRAQVAADRLYCADRGVYTSAGVTAGIDLALALVEADHGRAVALEVARLLVVYLHRPGGQAQFSTPLRLQGLARPALGDLVAYIEAHPEADLSVDALAARVHMSPRHFARVFTREIGLSPAKCVVRARVEAARRHLEVSPLGVDEVASLTGFGTTESLRRAFARTLGVAPSDYRARFAGQDTRRLGGEGELG